MPAIDVEHLEITFPLYHGSARTLRGALTRTADTLRGQGPSGHLMRDRRDRVVASVLRDVTFSLKPGERLGLVGGNGAGKTTLLRALAGVYEPVAGRVRVSGRLGTLLDTGLGMNPDLTGRENIRLRCRFADLGASRTREVEADVAEFAELGRFLDMPMKVYSSGMAIRLSFGLATAIAPEVLLMDEWFLAGDQMFLARAEKRMSDLVHMADIMVIATHQPAIMRQWCTRAIWLEGGEIRMDGTPEAVLDAYLGPSLSARMPVDEREALAR